MFQKTK